MLAAADVRNCDIPDDRIIQQSQTGSVTPEQGGAATLFAFDPMLWSLEHFQLDLPQYTASERLISNDLYAQRQTEALRYTHELPIVW
jgi:hypothetical protein